MDLRNSNIYRGLRKRLDPVMGRLRSGGAAAPAEPVDRQAWDADGVGKGWVLYQPDLVRTEFDDASLVMQPKCECAWYQNWRGPMLYRLVVGDGAASVTVRTRKASDGDKYPDDMWQFGGLILRDPASDSWFSNESYVFNAVGYRADRLAIEAKSTRHGYSEVIAEDWDSGDAELLLIRKGSSCAIRARAVGSSQWTEVCAFDRPDLPMVLQLGVMTYAYSDGQEVFDIRAEFGNLDVAFPR